MEFLAAPAEGGDPPTPIRILTEANTPERLAAAGPRAQAYAKLHGFSGEPGQVLLTPGDEGGTGVVLVGAPPPGQGAEIAALRGLAGKLAAGSYQIASAPEGFDTGLAALGFALGGYVFDRYKAERGKPHAKLVVAEADRRSRLQVIAHACALARAMVDTPANDMGPLQIETIARELAEAFGAAIVATVGDALLDAGYPAVHAVGRAAVPARAPRMIELSWRGSGAGAGEGEGAPHTAPHIALIGKGVVFDTGGLDIKPSSGMRNMKKDMGGAAHALALARMVMAADLPVRLSVLIPAVENAISGDAMRPGDVLATRKGLSVEVGNTDAEGRLILADALTRAAELAADLTIDLATLTGAARVALGPDLPPFYTRDDGLAGELAQAAAAVGDPVWRMPLWDAYEGALASDVADLKNDADAWVQAGSITAALFLRRFAPTAGSWLHLDIFAWNPRKRPGYPVGGEAQAIRALFHLLCARYAASPPDGPA